MALNLSDPIDSVTRVDVRAGTKRSRGGRRARLLLIAGVVVALGGAAVVYKRSTGRAFHDYDSGPVRTESITTTGIHAEVGETVTFGGIILENFSSRPAILESIRIDPPLNPGLSLVDVKVAGKNRGIGMVGTDRVFPPAGMPLEAVRPLPGAVVPPRHEDDKWGVEVLMAFKLNQPGQFGFRHTLIDYRIGGERHRVRMSDGFVVCGGPEYPSCDLEAFRLEDD